MTTAIQDKMAVLAELRLPELQARFAEIVGESTRSPNKQYLLRRIAETLEAKQTEFASDVDAAENADAVADEVEQTIDPEESTAEPNANEHDEADADIHDVKLTKLTVSELQERYRAVVGRGTSSTSAAYLQWKIRQAERGRIRVGPVQRRSGEAGEFKVLPLRMEATVVTRLDEARGRLGLRSRMDLIRQALRAYLASAGEKEVAAMLTGDEPVE